MAIAAETELWLTYIAQVEALDIQGNLLTFLRETLITSLHHMPPDWTARYLLTRYVVAHAGGSVLYDHSEAASLKAQRQLLETLSEKLVRDCREDVRFRMLGELVLSAWRCGASNWVAGRGAGKDADRGEGGLERLIIRIEEAFDAIPSSLALAV